MKKFAVIQFPGSNCDRDLLNAVLKAGAEAEFVDYRAASLAGYDGVLIPGGFSFGDYLRSGAMAAVAPVTKAIEEAADAGKPVLGICNGFQILTEIGLLPGALIFNDQHTFVSRDESLKIVNNETLFTRGYRQDEDIVYPVAHGEGHYYCDDATYERLKAHNQIVLTYNENPNGSRNDIAGIVNERGNVLGMMPHPERALETLLGSDDGLRLFEELIRWEANHVQIH